MRRYLRAHNLEFCLEIDAARLHGAQLQAKCVWEVNQSVWEDEERCGRDGAAWEVERGWDGGRESMGGRCKKVGKFGREMGGS